MPRVIQDGPLFYVFDDESGEPSDMIESPFPVSDFEVSAAREARAWFRAHYPNLADCFDD